MADEIVAVEIRDVEGFPGYGVSADGRVWSRRSRNGDSYNGPRRLVSEWREMRQYTDKIGRKKVNFKGGGICKGFQVHRLVLTAFVGPCPEGHECCHWDGNASNNAVENLRWDTSKENHADKKRHNTNNSGERHGLATLTAAIVREIRELHSLGVYQKDIATKFGIAPSTVSKITLRYRWSHVA